MDIEQSKVTKIKLTNIDRLDPITVFLEDFEPRRGKITINCYDASWSSFWGGMGSRNIAEFFVSCNNDYLIKNLSSVRSTIDDYDEIDTWLKKEIIKLRKEYDIDKSEAADLWSDVDLYCCNEKYWVESESGQKLCHRILGDEWWYSIPSKNNPEYEYLERVVNAVRDGLKLTLQPIAA